ncbi:diguanylate cyclase [Bordetella hinzii]|uniref:diguanylate cyclase n=1 Tax=Bordetella hinzii TaxID=103855 RepID=UPI00114FF530|nr:diguanylate cyclase [Bordetella hinzii]QDJ34230.1 diguanylate cyclase [Bordetella hinzii]
MAPALILLLYVLMPLWLLAGVADWLCHRNTHIAQTAGYRESLLHLLMFGEVGVALLAGLFLEVTAGVFALMMLCFLLHEATALWDVSYAVRRRRVTPLEQHVHSFLEILPLTAILLLAVGHWPQFLALFGLGQADWGFRLKETPLPAGYIVTLLSAVALLEVLPYLEEFWRGWRRRRTTAATARRA